MQLAAAIAAALAAVAGQAPVPGDAPARFAAVVAEYEGWRDTVWPEDALAAGRPSAAPDLIADRSMLGVESRHAQERIFLDDLRAIDPAQLSGDDLLGWQILVRQLDA